MIEGQGIDALAEIDRQRAEREHQLNRAGGQSTRGGKGLLIIAGLFSILLTASVVGYVVYKNKIESQTAAAATAVTEEVKVALNSQPTREVGGVKTEPTPAPVVEPEKVDVPPPEPAPASSSPDPSPAYQPVDENGQRVPTPEELARARKLKSSFTSGEGEQGSDDESNQSQILADAQNSATGSMGGGKDDFAEQFEPMELASTAAVVMPKRDFMLTQGEVIRCALASAIDTTVEGMTSCYTTDDVWSATGAVKLIPRHTKVTGMIKSGLKQGSKRIFALWNRMETSDGVIVRIGSPATDGLGRAGVDGYIDTHWGERFGNAILLSFIEDAISAAFEKTNNNPNNQINLSTTEQTTNSLANEAIKDAIDIPPTLTKNQGEIVGIFVARDVDFSGVYKYRAR